MTQYTYDYLKYNLQSLVEQARSKALLEVPVKIRDKEHYVRVVNHITNVYSSSERWGFTSLVVTDLVEKNDSVDTSILFFTILPDESITTDILNAL